MEYSKRWKYGANLNKLSLENSEWILLMLSEAYVLRSYEVITFGISI